MTTVGSEQTDAKAVLVSFSGRLYLIWAGTDNPHHLYVVWSTNPSNTWDTTAKVRLTDTTISGQGPAAVVFNNSLYMAWTGTDTPGHLNVGVYTGASTLSSHTTLSETSNTSPALAVAGGRLYLAWVGSDPMRHLNLISSSDGVHWSNKITLNDTAAFGPAMAYYQGTCSNPGIWIAWAGTDSNNTPNTAWFTGAGLACKVTHSGEHSDGDMSMLSGGGYLHAYYPGQLGCVNNDTTGNGVTWDDVNMAPFCTLVGTSPGIGVASYAGTVYWAFGGNGITVEPAAY